MTSETDLMFTSGQNKVFQLEYVPTLQLQIEVCTDMKKFGCVLYF